MSNALIVFVKNWETGNVKTRIAQDIGTAAASAIYQKLLLHTYHIIQPLNSDIYIYYADAISSTDQWEKDRYIKRLQQNTDLGSRMFTAFEEVFQDKHDKVCIIGSDCLQLSTDTLKQAFELLDQYDIVIGPAVDGGYYLLGMKEQVRPVFSSINWSTNQVFDQTIQLIKKHSYSFALLTQLADIDTVHEVPEDWITELRKKGYME